MTWLKLDDKFAGNPKITPLSDGAFRLHVAGMLYCAQHETDGRIPPEAVPTLMPKFRRGYLDELISSDRDLWHRNGVGYVVHDFTEYNPSRDQLQARRRATRERLAKWRSENRKDEDGE